MTSLSRNRELKENKGPARPVLPLLHTNAQLNYVLEHSEILSKALVVRKDSFQIWDLQICRRTTKDR